MLVTVDTGGTKTLVASFSESGEIIDSTKFPTPKEEFVYVSSLAKTIETIAGDTPIETIVVAMPGMVKDGVAIWCFNLGWSNFDVKRAVAKLYPDATILVENDANLGGLGEAWALKTMPQSVLYTTVSTGIGTGVITDGVINDSLRLSEGGHVLVEYNGIVSDWEVFASGRAIHEVYGKFARDIHDARTWSEIADRISRGFLALIPFLQPDIVIIGGSMGSFFSQYETKLIGILNEKLPSHIPCPPFVAASHPEQAVVYGCYYYAKQTLAATGGATN